MATPNQMPKKANVLHQQILAGLLAVKPANWKKKTWNDEKESVETSTVLGVEPRNNLARNVAIENVDRMAKRWL